MNSALSFGVNLHWYDQGSHVSPVTVWRLFFLFPTSMLCVSILCAALELLKLAFFLLCILKMSSESLLLTPSAPVLVEVSLEFSERRHVLD